jgi:hypothetical protein
MLNALIGISENASALESLRASNKYVKEHISGRLPMQTDEEQAEFKKAIELYNHLKATLKKQAADEFKQKKAQQQKGNRE